jgi:hypothetical protein
MNQINWRVTGLVLAAIAAWFALVIILPALLVRTCAPIVFCVGISADEGSLRLAILWSLGGVIASVTLWFTYKKHRLEQDADWTGRYTEAISQLASEFESVRTGGLYALERIARDSPRDRTMISRVVASYIKFPSHEGTFPKPPDGSTPISPTVYVACEVLSDVTRLEPLRHVLSFKGVYLAGANFKDANLNGVDFTDSILRNASFAGASLGGADFYGANVVHVDFIGADLRKTVFFKANLNKAMFHNAKLEGARFFRRGVNQASATNWDSGSLNSAASWDIATVWPKGFEPQSELKLS